MSPFNSDMRADLDSKSHLTDEDLAAYLDRNLDATSLARFDTHMARCAECRADFVEARSLLESTDALSVSSRLVLGRRAVIWLAAAGILTIAFLPLLRREGRLGEGSKAVRAPSSAPLRIEIVAPPERQVASSAVVFTWRSVEGASTYRVTVADSAGSALFNTVTSDTSVTPPAGVEIRRGGTYLWYVDGLTSDGRTVGSGIHSFSTQR